MDLMSGTMERLVASRIHGWVIEPRVYRFSFGDILFKLYEPVIYVFYFRLVNPKLRILIYSLKKTL